MCLSCQSQPSAGSWLGGTPITADTCANHKVLCNPAERHRRMNRAWQLFSWVVQHSNMTHRCRRTFSKCSYEHVSKASVDCLQKTLFPKTYAKTSRTCLPAFVFGADAGRNMLCCVYVCIILDVAIGATASHQTWSLLMASLSEHTHPDNVDPTGDM